MTKEILDADIIEDINLDTSITPRQQHIRELRDLLNVLEANPTLEMPTYLGHARYSPVQWFPSSATAAANIVKALGGRWEKNDPNNGEYNAANLVMKARLGHELHVDVTVSREGVCEKKVVGTEKKKVERVVVEQVTEEVYEDVDVIKFECKSLMSLADQNVMDALESIAS